MTLSIHDGPSPTAINGASTLHDRHDSWAAGDCILENVREVFPTWDTTSSYAKAVAVNSLYSTNVYSIWQMAVYISTVMSDEGVDQGSPALVEKIAALPKADGDGVVRHFRSFASKFCHFFVNEDRFPILDWYSDWMLKFFLGPEYRYDEKMPYLSHCENFNALHGRPGLKGFSGRQIDRFLWVSGQYLYWKKHPDAAINSGLRDLFLSDEAEVVDAVRAIADCVLGPNGEIANAEPAEALSREHVLAAMIAFDQGAGSAYGPSKAYDVLFKGRRYPPKAIYGLAVGELTGVPLEPGDFTGGKVSTCHKTLEALGFDIVEKSTQS